jgi:hypothetical protein
MVLIFPSVANSKAVMPFESLAFMLKPSLYSNRTTGLFPCSTATCSIVFPFSSNFVRSAPFLKSHLINVSPPSSNTNFQLFLLLMMISADLNPWNRKTGISSDAGVCGSFLISSAENSRKSKMKIYSSKDSKQGVGRAKCCTIAACSR